MTLTKIASTGVEDSLRWVLGANGTSDYTFTGPGLTGTVNDPTIYLTRGHTYIFQNNSGGHPFYIKTSIANGGTNDAYNTGVTNNGGGNGTEIVFTVPHDSPDILYYQCSSHSSMAGQFNIAGSVADGSITAAKLASSSVTSAKIASENVDTTALSTNAVSTVKIQDGAVTGAKLADLSVSSGKIVSAAVTSTKIADGNVTTAKIGDSAVTENKIHGGAVTQGKLADNSVTTNKIAVNAVTNSHMSNNSVGTAEIYDEAITLAKLEHGTSSNDGKFLRANNGADPTFETVTGTTINSNGANRVITGSNTANTLNGETNVHVTSDKLLIGTSNVNTGLPYTSSGGIQTLGAYNTSSINIVNNENSGNTSALTFNKIRGASGAVSASDNMGGINWAAWDGSAWKSGITVEGKLTGSGANNVPSKLTFKINSGSSNTERFAITPNGVTFNGDTAAANALDDYEEGTFNASYYENGGVTLVTNADGKYTKIGNRVYISIFEFAYGGASNKNIYYITGLPFTAHSQPNSVGTICRYSGGNHQEIAASQACYIAQGGTQIKFNGHFASGSGNWTLSLVYETA